MKIACLFSVPHTGTQFMLEFLKPHFGHFVEMGRLRKNRVLLQGEMDGLEKSETNLVQGHFDSGSMDYVTAFSCCLPTIVPLRDPLLSLISTEVRSEPTVPITEQWTRLVERIDPHDPFYVPLDLLDTQARRVSCLYGALDHVLERVKSNEIAESRLRHVNRTALDWKEVNSRGTYALKLAYNAGHTGPLEKFSWWRWLRGAQSLLRPALEKAGYRDLLWWD